MPQRLARHLGVATALAVLGLCHCRGVLGFDELVPRPTAGEAAAHEATAKLLAGGVCAFYQQCDQTALARTDYGDACPRAMVPWARQLVSARGAMVTDANVRDCMAALERGKCNERLDTVGPCSFVGALADREPCAFAAQCASGACDSVPGNCGSCVPRIAVGAPCDGQRGLCDVGATCSGGRCRRRVGPGEVCGAGLAECLPTLRCLGGQCGPLAGQGESCSTSTECDRQASNLECTGAAGAMACSVMTTAGIRERCQVADATAPRIPCRYSYCSFNTCLPYPSLGDPAPMPDACDDITLVAKGGICDEKYPSECR